MIESAGVRVDEQTRRVWVNGAEVRFTRMEFDLLVALMTRAGETVTRDELMRHVWKAPWYSSTKTIDVHVGFVRRKLGNYDAITTIRGKGLRFEAA
jgi:DNA-binding response OmpR family regulator